MIIEEVALQLNLGHTPTETIRKHYAYMQDSEREEIVDELCRRALPNGPRHSTMQAFGAGGHGYLRTLT